MQPLTLKPYTAEDFEAFNSWIEDEDLLFSFAGVEFTWPLKPDQLESHFQKYPDREWYIGLDNGAPVAFGEIIPQEGNIPRLGRLLIKQGQRGGGLGKRFIHALELRSVERFSCEAIELYVFAENDPAIACYKSYGFEFLPEQEVVITHKEKQIRCHKMRCAVGLHSIR